MGLFAFERMRRLEKERLDREKEAAKRSGLEEFRMLKEEADNLGIDVPKGTKKEGLKKLIMAAKKAGDKNGENS